ncbi:AAA family ATPase [Stenotrophomonas sp. SY1]|uniref:AAA family ATPase n=1 Tax=Stenotrophomonas sp. SY1 TaxID=477235 RepID=UPI001E2DBCF9|nr:AAA family ATPase [Stenotrophomonas sp. SY1]MCD9088544.1 AAA family ATPase [Stenotrophomonas sp. SY1]
MSRRITSLSVRDFRSIRGSITIPLDSPVVLVHGRNGAGKTSLLSALELGLTGSASSLDLVDATSSEHLIHKEADNASVSLCVSGFDNLQNSTEIRIDSGVHGNPLLGKELRNHYVERCYLGQSSLSRLFDIYQQKGKSASSPLTSFIKELLGLDALEALIDGLHDAGDVRRLRGRAVRYWEVRDVLPSLQAEAIRLENDLAAAKSNAKELSDEIQLLVALHWPEMDFQDAEATLVHIRSQSREEELQAIASRRREVSSLAIQIGSAESTSDASTIDDAAAAAALSEKALDQWRATTGQQLDDVFVRLDSLFKDLPSPTSSRPDYALTVALKLANSELERCRSVLQNHNVAIERTSSIADDMQGLSARLASIDEKIALHSNDASQLAQALSALVPHVHGDGCPVCDRNFSEVSSTPLLGHLTAKVSSLTHSAGQLSALSGERAGTIRQLDAKSREIEILKGSTLDVASQSDVSLRMTIVIDAVSALDSLGESAKHGEHLFALAAESSQALEALRLRDDRGALLRNAATKVLSELGVTGNDPARSLKEMLDESVNILQARENAIQAAESARQRTESALNDLVLRERSIRDIEDRQAVLRKKQAGLTSDLERGNKAIDSVKSLLKLAQDERVEIVRRVFNDSLNAAWKDLFVRLAPEEPFVPAFSVPKQSRSDFQATLETLYRDGRRGGNPRAMLSAGNLNTAALTLFLALHLSVRPQLPWLVIDDPVQSMDEVHISQFAALLRTLSKQQNRQIIVAVHEKPLFDYLCLELSPAFEGDRLISVELGRAADGNTVADCIVREWARDHAIAA